MNIESVLGFCLNIGYTGISASHGSFHDNGTKIWPNKGLGYSIFRWAHTGGGWRLETHHYFTGTCLRILLAASKIVYVPHSQWEGDSGRPTHIHKPAIIVNIVNDNPNQLKNCNQILNKLTSIRYKLVDIPFPTWPTVNPHWPCPGLILPQSSRRWMKQFCMGMNIGRGFQVVLGCFTAMAIY